MSKTAKVVEESHPDWKVFNGKAAQAVVFSNFAYQQKDDEMQELADKMPKGYEMFLMTDHVQEVGEASFRCVAFMNQNTKEIVFATAGSRFGMDEKGFADIYDSFKGTTAVFFTETANLPAKIIEELKKLQ